ncbi:saccharopine dehydrogenase [Pseudooceanicola sp.]|uniref:saccharopine dehydrogenase n=1 Tax=Pseudooceanicola sp. TaxID=1914328 RepID=UPI0026182BC6|nr:saccharopine dehydrogenase [Pseudooceanicola sp.]MDF1855710.1 saccharopine dehydrogenase [Pseudooceanicola sp.]
MTHLWLRAEQRPNEDRTGLTPDGAARLIAQGIRLTVEDSGNRILPTAAYRAAGAEIAPAGSWPGAPRDAIIFGLKELPEDGSPLPHRHIMFGHAFKGQPAGRLLLERFRTGGGRLYDLEYLLDEDSRRVAAFGYWAGYAGAAVALKCWLAQRAGGQCGPISAYPDKAALLADLHAELARELSKGTPPPSAIVIGALGRVGSGASSLCAAMGIKVTKWDKAETASGGPFPEIARHDVFLNCILAMPGTPVLVPADLPGQPRQLSVIGDIACDPSSDFSPIKVYDRTTSWSDPALRVHATPPLDVTAIDNLPSLLPLESSQDYAAQLLPSLLSLDAIDAGVWGRAGAIFDHHMRERA